MATFHFTGKTIRNGQTSKTHHVTVTASSVLDGALIAGHEVRNLIRAESGDFLAAGHLTCERTESAPVECGVWAEGRRMGLSNEQIERFIARQS